MLVSFLPVYVLVLTLLQELVASEELFTMSSLRRRGNLARTIYNRMKEDEQHKNDPHSYWYYVDTSVMPADICSKFLLLHEDDETKHFLNMCFEKADWVFTQMYHSVAKSVLSWFMENTSINGLLGRGSMFVFSKAQFAQLLNIEGEKFGENMLDLGAGDGEVTKKMAPFFTNVYATETSGPMVNRLTTKGYKMMHVEQWDSGLVTFDFISCLNLLDRCDKPVSVLHSMKKVLKPGGRVAVAIVLPFSPYVEFGGAENKPIENLDIKGETFEAQCVSLVRDVFEPAGFILERFTRLPYLCEGDLESSFYELDDAVFILRVKDIG